MSGRGSDLLDAYDRGGYFCEITGLGAAASPGPAHLEGLRRRLGKLRLPTLRRRSRDCERELYNLGITFTVYTERDAIDRVLPFDVIPRPQPWPSFSAPL